jgi:hypothetical protein
MSIEQGDRDIGSSVSLSWWRPRAEALLAFSERLPTGESSKQGSGAYYWHYAFRVLVDMSQNLRQIKGIRKRSIKG